MVNIYERNRMVFLDNDDHDFQLKMDNKKIVYLRLGGEMQFRTICTANQGIGTGMDGKNYDRMTIEEKKHYLNKMNHEIIKQLKDEELLTEEEEQRKKSIE